MANPNETREAHIRADIVTPPPGYQAQPVGEVRIPLPNNPHLIVPAGITPEMAEYFNRLVDSKISGTLHGLQVESAEDRQLAYQRDLRNKVLIGAGAFVGGVVATALWRKWREGQEEDGAGDDDMGDDDGRGGR